jgi:hypothetical protein
MASYINSLICKYNVPDSGTCNMCLAIKYPVVCLVRAIYTISNLIVFYNNKFAQYDSDFYD